ncbi:zinc knuckle-domain-containing protein [Tirmania nivea]|nr:zinc knuckle-domain-containing protein [Tirmania nivea]
MNRYRGTWSSAASSKASPSTTCQKCLKKGHYSYECKVSNVERPYISRPSRTQQLFDPNVRQKLTMAAPPEVPKNDLTRKEGIADEILAKKESDRRAGKKRRRESPSVSPARHSRRSPSISSVSSYSSMSSGRSPSPPRCSTSRKARSPSPRSASPDRRVRRRYRDSPSPEHGRGRRLSPTDQRRRSRSRSSALGRRTPLPLSHQQQSAPRRRERSLSPFSRRVAMTKAMGRANGS